jgi:hypothetical protein
MCDLSPIELELDKVKRLVQANDITGELSLQSLADVTKSAIASVTKEDWAGYSKHVQMLEQKYWKGWTITRCDRQYYYFSWVYRQQQQWILSRQ